MGRAKYFQPLTFILTMCARSLGGYTRSDIRVKKPCIHTYVSCTIEKECCIHGYYVHVCVYMDIWEAVIGEELNCKREPAIVLTDTPRQL